MSTPLPTDARDGQQLLRDLLLGSRGPNIHASPFSIGRDELANCMKMHGLDDVMSEVDNRICLVLHLFSGACVSRETPDVPTACDAFHRGFASAIGMSSFMFNTVLTSNIHHF